mgnify:CR=1 FL=1
MPALKSARQVKFHHRSESFFVRRSILSRVSFQTRKPLSNVEEYLEKETRKMMNERTCRVNSIEILFFSIVSSKKNSVQRSTKDFSSMQLGCSTGLEEERERERKRGDWEIKISNWNRPSSRERSIEDNYTVLHCVLKLWPKDEAPSNDPSNELSSSSSDFFFFPH